MNRKFKRTKKKCNVVIKWKCVKSESVGLPRPTSSSSPTVSTPQTTVVARPKHDSTVLHLRESKEELH